MLPELELELLGSEIFLRAGAGASKLQTFLPELQLELRVLDTKKSVGAKSGAAKVMFQLNLDTNLKLYFSNSFLAFIITSILMSNNTGNLRLGKSFQNPHLAFYLKQMDKPN